MSVTDLLCRNSTTERLAVIFFGCFAWFFNNAEESLYISLLLFGILVG